MSGVSLSSGVGSILLSLQHAAAQTNAIQNRLATGKKVASALDNPSSYFTATALGRRAGDLDALLDQIGQARQTLAAAGNGIASGPGAGQEGVFRSKEVEAALSGSFTADAAKGAKVPAGNINSDLHGSAAYRAHLVSVLAGRAVTAAA